MIDSASTPRAGDFGYAFAYSEYVFANDSTGTRSKMSSCRFIVLAFSRISGGASFAAIASVSADLASLLACSRFFIPLMAQRVQQIPSPTKRIIGILFQKRCFLTFVLSVVGTAGQ